jgi:hypothetical protein
MQRGATRVRFVLGGRLSNFLRRPKDQNTRKFKPDTSNGQLGLRAELYSVHCIKTHEPALVCAERPRFQEVTLVQMAFASCDIWIALPGDGVAFVEVN